MAWTSVTYSVDRQDQGTANFDPTSGTITLQRIMTIVAQDDGAGGTPTLAGAYGANDGTNSVPIIGGIYTIEGQAGYVCTQVMPRRMDKASLCFEIQVTYSAKFGYQPAETTNWNITISLGGQTTNQTMYQGYNTETSAVEDVVNSAGQAFDPSIEETLYDETISVSYNTTSPPDLSTYRGYTNSSSVSFTISGISRTYAENTLLCKDGKISTTVNLMSDGTTPVWNVSIELLNRTDTFVTNILDQGYYTNDGTSLNAIKDKNGDLLSSPVKLDGSGGKLAEGGTPVYRHFVQCDASGDPLQTDLNPLFDGLTD